MHFFVVLFFFLLLFRVSGVLSCLFADVPHKPNSQSQIKHWVLQNFVDTRFLKVVHGSVVASLFKAISLRRACSDILTEKAIPPTFARPGIGARKLVLLVWFQSQWKGVVCDTSSHFLFVLLERVVSCLALFPLRCIGTKAQQGHALASDIFYSRKRTFVNL